MLSLAADENFNARITRGLRRRLPEIDLLTVQQAGLAGAEDPAVLEWAAPENRRLPKHDVSTMTRLAWDWVRGKRRLPELIAIPCERAIGRVLDDLVVVVTTSVTGCSEDQGLTVRKL